MNDAQQKHRIQQALAAFAQGILANNTRHLLDVLGYRSERGLDAELTPEEFIAEFAGDGQFNRDNALLDHWQSFSVIFQLAGEDLTHGEQLRLLDPSRIRVDDTIIESYLFLAIRLRGSSYSRTRLAAITREVNKLTPMPAMLIFQHGDALTLAVINRRLHQRDESRDVLEKVTLIKEITFADPHRAHIEILLDLSLDRLYKKHGFTNFVDLHRAWQQTLDASELNKRFFREIANWYFWAVQNVSFPKDAGDDVEIRNATSVIRLITRLIFVWFLKEKGLVPDALFNEARLRDILVSLEPQESSYYKAILQNLFFATLNQEMNIPQKPNNRKFRGEGRQHYNITNLYRYRRFFCDPNAALCLFEDIPFLNGGLFECLDKRDDEGNVLRVDGFSDREDNMLSVPNDLFFGGERNVDLNDAYGTRNKRYKVQGLISILNRYKFTIAENTPIEEEVALDPELLGKVFENLLAAYNPETDTTARKQTGSFYTPREIVHYMVDESLILYLEDRLCGKADADRESVNARLRHLLAYNEQPHRFEDAEVIQLIDAIDHVKILDPACGSGAFPMGVLHKLVSILSKLDPHNERWKARQIQKVEQLEDSSARESAIQAIEQTFEQNELDYGRKLYLIENCIYGVDIQPIAVQIAKLRFFISLVVDQRVDDTQENRGILPLPNLETKFVAANTLFGIGGQLMLPTQEILQKERALADVRHRHFTARTWRTKRKYRELDRQIRNEISALLRASGLPPGTARQLADWDPYGQNASADFFDPEWMFSIPEGFDIVIGNPPYVRQEQIKELKPDLKERYDCYTGVADLYVYFYERGHDLLKPSGVLAYISSNKYFRAGYGKKLRRMLANRFEVHQLIDFGDAPVFTAIAYPSIFIGRKSVPTENEVHALTWKAGPPIEEFPSVFQAGSFLIAQKLLTPDGWRLETPAVFRLLEKLREAGTPLGDYVNGRFYRGILTGFNEAFVVDRAIRDRLIAEHPSSAELLKPFLRGRDVKRWRVDFADQYLIKIESSANKEHPWSAKTDAEAEKVFADTYPAIHARFEIFRDRLIRRDDQGQYFWELRSCIYWQEFEQAKIIYPDIAQDTAFAYDDEYHYLVNTLYLLPTDRTWLLALLNSRAVFWLYTKVSTQIRGGFVRFIAQYVSQIPIPEPADPGVIEAIVRQILEAKGSNPDADVSALEREIDERVYSLYGLTREEIEIVERG